MSLIPSEAKKIEVMGATVDFFKLEKDGESSYYFDTSKCGPPDPMVNAMVGLQLIKNSDDTLIMINHKSPGGLFAKLEEDISSNVETLENGVVRVTFKNIHNTGIESDLSDASCHG